MASSPARIYANADLGVSFLISELNLNESLYFPVSKAIMRWAKESKCELIISSGTIVSQNTKGVKHVRKEHKYPNIYGAASTESAMQRMTNCDIPELELYNGPVTGIPGLLLNEGATINFDVIVLLGKVQIQTSEHRAAAAISQAIMKLVPGLTCDTRFLISLAKDHERDLRRLRAIQAGYNIDPYR
jgi:predicted ATP-grasp superfamily ATP-dependent carboligase